MKINDNIYDMSTPIMMQYKEIKQKHKDALLFFRLGDFYELFYEDAKKVAEILNIVLTKRAHKKEDIPMAGVPHHTSEYYINKLVKAGYKVAICEQVSKELNQEKIIPREVVQIITPGTITSETMLESKRNNFLMSIEEDGLNFSIARFDITTNEFFIEEIEKCNLKSYIEKIDPKELLVNQNIGIKLKEYGINQNPITIIQPLSQHYAENIIMKFFDLHSSQSINYLRNENKIATAYLLEYIQYTQKQNKLNIKLPQKLTQKEEVELDAFTRRNLEITKTLKNTLEGSLLSFIDQTKTAQGGRKIYTHLTTPINNIKKLNERFDNIEFFKKDEKTLKKVQKMLKNIPDFERILSKIILKKATPQQIYEISIGAKSLYELCKMINQNISKHEELFNEILRAIDETAPKIEQISTPYILPHYNLELDEWKEFHKDIYHQIQILQEQYQNITKINNLKIKETPLGFLIEINNSNQNKLHYSFELRQTLKSSARYSTKELDVINSKFSQSEAFILEKERLIFDNFCNQIEIIAPDIYQYSKISATIDVFSTLAHLANEFNFVRPLLTSSNDFEVTQGRHPILQKLFLQKGDIFVPNDCNLTQNLLFMTGPNMAGKSTYLRQQAIICLLAHCGMFVPCEYAKIGIVDQIFSRISTNDDIMQGNSTFMVEMIEMSLTINRATSKSFLILDEVGRGTSVEEGIALAQSILEYLLNHLEARTMFATHYLSLGNIKHKNMQKKMMQIISNPLTFIYQIVDGVATKSYAIDVAKIAGMPKEIIIRAEEILKCNN